MNRRQFFKTSVGAAALIGLKRKAYAFSQSPGLQLWKTNLRGAGAIPVASPDASPAPVTGVKHYTIDIVEFQDTLVDPAANIGPSTLWGFNPAGNTSPAHLGGIIVAERDKPVQITFRNRLTDDESTAGIPLGHPNEIDTTVPGDFSALPPGQNNRIAVHMHGGHVPWISDGGPFDWFTPDGLHGQSFLNNQVLNPAADENEAEYYYPNDQSARLMWYHDHAFGMDRCSAYAGVASAYIIRDGFEGNLRNYGLPDYVENGGREIPLVFQDKIFCGANILQRDPTWSGRTDPGDLWYAHVYDTARYGKLGPNPLGVPPDPSCVPEFFGDTMLVNGTVFPQVTLEARRYRFRILNACNSRFMNLQMYVADASPEGITLNSQGVPVNLPAVNAAALNKSGKPTTNFVVIGTEGGFLPRAAFASSNVPFGGPALGSLFLAPAERADVIFDFSAHANQTLILYTDAPSPFPGGDPRNDYFPGLNPSKNPVNGLTARGFGPNTRVLLRINVTPATSKDAPLNIARYADLTAGNDPLLATVGKAAIPAGIPIRQLTLNEGFDGYGRLMQELGTNVALPGGVFGRSYLDPPTETPLAGATEIWQIANLTADTHPIHFHLVNVQIISRQPFSKQYNGTPAYTAPAVPPAPYEAGWKETVRMNPGEVTTVMMQFNLPSIQGVNSIPASPRTGGNEYVWHCHILEHEEHDMMRPLIVT